MSHSNIPEKNFKKVSFLEEDDSFDRVERRSMNFFEKHLQGNVFVFYTIMFGICEYLILYILLDQYLGFVEKNISNEENNYINSQICKYFFFRSMTVIFHFCKSNFQSNPLRRISVFFSNFVNKSTYFIYSLFFIIIWMAIIEIGSVMLISSLLIIVKSKYFYKIISQTIQFPYANKKHHNIFLLLFICYLVLNILEKSSIFLSVIFLIFAGFLFFINEDILMKDFFSCDIVLLHHFGFFMVFIYYLIKYFWFYQTNSFFFNYQDLYLGCFLLFVGFLKYLFYQKINNLDPDSTPLMYQDMTILYVASVSFIIDLIIVPKENKVFHFLITALGLFSLFYFNHHIIKKVLTFKSNKGNNQEFVLT
jgi:hypothetical protein